MIKDIIKYLCKRTATTDCLELAPLKPTSRQTADDNSKIDLQIYYNLKHYGKLVFKDSKSGLVFDGFLKAQISYGV